MFSNPSGRLTSTLNFVGVILFDLFVNGARIGDRRMMQDRGVRRAGVFGIEIERAADERFVRKVSAEFETPLDRNSARFEHLRDDLGEQCGFREVFRADDDTRLARGSRCVLAKDQTTPSTTSKTIAATASFRARSCGLRFVSKLNCASTRPSKKSAPSASNAADTAPASNRLLSYCRKPRKM